MPNYFSKQRNNKKKELQIQSQKDEHHRAGIAFGRVFLLLQSLYASPPFPLSSSSPRLASPSVALVKQIISLAFFVRPPPPPPSPLSPVSLPSLPSPLSPPPPPPPPPLPPSLLRLLLPPPTLSRILLLVAIPTTTATPLSAAPAVDGLSLPRPALPCLAFTLFCSCASLPTILGRFPSSSSSSSPFPLGFMSLVQRSCPARDPFTTPATATPSSRFRPRCAAAQRQTNYSLRSMLYLAHF